MIKTITEKLYQPIIYFFLLPLVSLLPGTVFALQYGEINYIALTAFYIYIVVNQLIENILLRIPTNDFQLSKKLLISLELINFLCIIFFSFHYSWMSAATLLLYTLTIQLQFLFSYYDLETTAALIASFLKLILLNGFAFYIHTNFIHFRFFPYYFGLFLPYFIYELTRSEVKVNHNVILAITGFSYLFSFVLLWKNLAFLSLLLLITFPFIFTFKETLDRKYMATFLIVYSIMYITLIAFGFIA